MRKPVVILVVLLACGFLAGCQSIYYSTWEKLGKEKRDLLHTKVEQVRDGEAAAAQQLKDALTRLQEVYGTQNTDLEKTYKKLQADYDKSVDRANDVHKRIAQMDQIARDLFKEWEKEAQSIGTPSLREDSQRQLRDTQERYKNLYEATTRAEKSLQPVLAKFQDYVLYLKHNLNAASLGTLQGEAKRIQGDISQLITDMNASIKEADAFIKANKK